MEPSSESNLLNSLIANYHHDEATRQALEGVPVSTYRFPVSDAILPSYVMGSTAATTTAIITQTKPRMPNSHVFFPPRQITHNDLEGATEDTLFYLLYGPQISTDAPIIRERSVRELYTRGWILHSSSPSTTTNQGKSVTTTSNAGSGIDSKKTATSKDKSTAQQQQQQPSSPYWVLSLPLAELVSIYGYLDQFGASMLPANSETASLTFTPSTWSFAIIPSTSLLSSHPVDLAQVLA